MFYDSHVRGRYAGGALFRRMRRPRIPRDSRLCKLCSVESGRFSGQQLGPHVEDLLPFMLECPACDDTRFRSPSIVRVALQVAGLHPLATLRPIFCGDHQGQLATCLCSMNDFRAECFRLPPALLGCRVGGPQG
jgi:hypothetical protein